MAKKSWLAMYYLLNNECSPKQFVKQLSRSELIFKFLKQKRNDNTANDHCGYRPTSHMKGHWRPRSPQRSQVTICSPSINNWRWISTGSPSSLWFTKSYLHPPYKHKPQKSKSFYYNGKEGMQHFRSLQLI